MIEDKDLKARTKKFTIDILKLVEKIPFSTTSKVITYQLAKSGSSVGANYRASCRARSDNEFLSKMNIVLEESDETLFWLEIIEELELISKGDVKQVLSEAYPIDSHFCYNY